MFRAEAMYKFYDTEQKCRYNDDTTRSVNNYILQLCIKVVLVGGATGRAISKIWGMVEVGAG